jgi:hypothetical protein
MTLDKWLEKHEGIIIDIAIVLSAITMACIVYVLS